MDLELRDSGASPDTPKVHKLSACGSSIVLTATPKFGVPNLDIRFERRLAAVLILEASCTFILTSTVSVVTVSQAS